jgi:hypothetical protein
VKVALRTFVTPEADVEIPYRTYEFPYRFRSKSVSTPGISTSYLVSALNARLKSESGSTSSRVVEMDPVRGFRIRRCLVHWFVTVHGAQLVPLHMAFYRIKTLFSKNLLQS